MKKNVKLANYFNFVIISSVVVLTYCSDPSRKIIPNYNENNLNYNLRSHGKSKKQFYKKYLLKKDLTSTDIINLINIYYLITESQEKHKLNYFLSNKITPQIMKSIIYRMKSHKLKLKINIAKYIDSLNNNSLINEIYKLLNHPNRFVTQNASFLLLHSNSKKLSTLFDENINKSSSFSLKLSVIKIIGKKKSWRLLETAFKIFNIKDSVLKEYSIWAFNQIHKKNQNKVLPFLMSKLQNNNKIDQNNALNILSYLKTPKLIFPLISLLNKNYDNKLNRKISLILVSMVNKETLEIFLNFLRLKNPKLQNELIWILGESNKKQIIPHLIFYLDHPDPKIKCSTILSLIKLEKQSIGNDIIKKLSDKSLSVRLMAIWALAHLELEIIPEKLFDNLKDKNYEIRQYSKWVILKLVSKKNIKQLIESPIERTSIIKTVLIDSLAKLKLKMGTNYLSSIVQSNNMTNLKVRAINALGKILDSSSMNILIESTKSENNAIRSSATKALGNFKNKKLLSLFVELLKDLTPNVRKEAAKAIGKLNLKEGIKPLIYTLNDENKNVRREVTKSLLKLKSTNPKIKLNKI